MANGVAQRGGIRNRLESRDIAPNIWDDEHDATQSTVKAHCGARAPRLGSSGVVNAPLSPLPRSAPGAAKALLREINGTEGDTRVSAPASGTQDVSGAPRRRSGGW